MAESTGSTRRDFLKRSAAVGTALTAPTIIPAHVLGRDNSPSANEQIIIGLIGTGGRCNQLIDQVPAPGKIVAASDCFLYRATETLKKKKIITVLLTPEEEKQWQKTFDGLFKPR